MCVRAHAHAHTQDIHHYLLCFIFLTFRQGTELVPPNIKIPQGTEAAQLHREELQLITAHILGQRRHCKARGSVEIALPLLSGYLLFVQALSPRVSYFSLATPQKSLVPGSIVSPSSGTCPWFLQAAAGFLRC